MVAVEFQTHPHLKLTPNFVLVGYDRNNEGQRPPTDLYLRLTFFLDLG